MNVLSSLRSTVLAWWKSWIILIIIHSSKSCFLSLRRRLTSRRTVSRILTTFKLTLHTLTWHLAIRRFLSFNAWTLECFLAKISWIFSVICDTIFLKFGYILLQFFLLLSLIFQRLFVSYNCFDLESMLVDQFFLYLDQFHSFIRLALMIDLTRFVFQTGYLERSHDIVSLIWILHANLTSLFKFNMCFALIASTWLDTSTKLLLGSWTKLHKLFGTLIKFATNICLLVFCRVRSKESNRSLIFLFLEAHRVLKSN